MRKISKLFALTTAAAVAAGAAGSMPAPPAFAAPIGDFPGSLLNKPGYYLTANDEFNVSGASLTPGLGNTRYLPHWSSVSNEARYSISNGALDLRIDNDTPAWDPGYDGNTKISGIQTAQRGGLHSAWWMVGAQQDTVPGNGRTKLRWQLSVLSLAASM